MDITRLISLDDAPTLTDLLNTNREFLSPREPRRPESYFSLAGQSTVIRSALDQHQNGASLPHVILDESGSVVGRITLNGIVRGPFQSCSVGYWVGEAHNGRGLAGAALRNIKRIAFDELGLHRIEGEALLDNIASQHVRDRTGFERIGMVPRFLRISGKWQDNILFQVLRTPDPEDEN